MARRVATIPASGSVLLVAALILFGRTAVAAQTSRSIELHANDNVTAAKIGLPDFPGARSYHETSNDSTADMGLTFGDFHFRILVSRYATDASPSAVLDFYGKPLSRYGEVLECEGGEAVGAVKVSNSGLTCSDTPRHHESSRGGSRSSRELRSGSPRVMRIVAIEDADSDVHSTKTHFSLVLLELPKDTAMHDDSK